MWPRHSLPVLIKRHGRLARRAACTEAADPSLKPRCKSGLERSDIKADIGGEAWIAEPPASGRNTASMDRYCKSGLERSDNRRTMDFQLTPEQLQLKKSLREFAEREILPHVMKWDEANHF